MQSDNGGKDTDTLREHEDEHNHRLENGVREEKENPHTRIVIPFNSALHEEK